MEDLRVKIYDSNGNIVLDGLVTSYSIECSSRYSARMDFKIEGVKIIDTTPPIPAISSPTCRHNWALYQGFTETYEYCDLCGVKK